jgi:hypothetical protein
MRILPNISELLQVFVGLFLLCHFLFLLAHCCQSSFISPPWALSFSPVGMMVHGLFGMIVKRMDNGQFQTTKVLHVGEYRESAYSLGEEECGGEC